MEVSRSEGVLHVELFQSDIEKPVELYSAFEDFILDRDERRIVVGLSGVHTLTSLMIGALVSIHLLAYENVVVLSFEDMHERIRALFRLIGVDKLLEAHYPPRSQV